MLNILLKYDNDAARVSWAHAVNSKENLLKILKSDVDCIESDLSYCGEDGTVYMAHPPSLRSDLTFHEYWHICQTTEKLIKLDFKMIEAVESTLKLINGRNMSRVILNADILQSAASSSKPLDKDRFLDLIIKYGSRSMLSLGWTTVKESRMGYTWSDMYEMMIILKLVDTDQMITLPVDIHMASLNSLSKLIFLLDHFKDINLSLTIWSYKDVNVDVNTLTALRRLLTKSSIYLDIPQLINSEQDCIISTLPASDNIQTLSCTNFVGDNVCCSRRSLIVGENSHITYETLLLNKMEFFIVFDSRKSECPVEDSECAIHLSLNGEFIKLFSLTKAGYSLSEQFTSVNNNSFEIVWFCSLEVISSNLSCILSKVEEYNTRNLGMKKMFSSKLIIEEGVHYLLTFNVRCSGYCCRFIVIDSDFL